MLQDLLAAYDSERLKTLSVWSAFGDGILQFRPARLAALRGKPAAWWDEPTVFFDVERSKARVMIRHLVYSAHHRALLTVYLRRLDRPLCSTYGPTADTGGLLLHHAPTMCRYDSIEALFYAEREGGEWPALPGPGDTPPTERP